MKGSSSERFIARRAPAIKQNENILGDAVHARTVSLYIFPSRRDVDAEDVSMGCG